MDDLNTSLNQYKDQISMVNQALETTSEASERESLLSLQNDLTQLIQLTQESIDALTNSNKNSEVTLVAPQEQEKSELDDEYALFMQEMAQSGAYENDKKSETNNDTEQDNNDASDIEDELASLLGMKCAVYHTHKWGGQPSLHNAMVSAVVPRGDDDQFQDLQVRVLFTHPTHTEMLPCPFYLDGQCRFTDELCRYSHGTVTPLSNLKEAIEPNFDALKPGTRILMKLKPPDDEDISLTKKSTEKYHLWHRAVVKTVDLDNKQCSVRLEHKVSAGEKRKTTQDEYDVNIEEIFPLDNGTDEESSDASLSDTEYPESKCPRAEPEASKQLLLEKSLEYDGPAMGQWERHTRGMGSKLMLAMGYVPGTGLGSAGAGRLQPVEARLVPQGKSLDHCMEVAENCRDQDPLKVEQRLKRLQKKEEERNRRAYEREKEKERRNVFNFLNRTIGDTEQETQAQSPSVDVKQSSSKDLNIEQFKINEDTRKLEREIVKLNSSLQRHASGTSVHRSITAQVVEKSKELDILRNREKQISKEQKQRKDKAKMTVF